jgi:hypothetical protein
MKYSSSKYYESMILFAERVTGLFGQELNSVNIRKGEHKKLNIASFFSERKYNIHMSQTQKYCRL